MIVSLRRRHNLCTRRGAGVTTTEDYEYMAAGGSEGGGELELMIGEGRGCDDVGTSPVEFGYDGVGCCVLSLSRDALAEVGVRALAEQREIWGRT